MRLGAASLSPPMPDLRPRQGYEIRMEDVHPVRYTQRPASAAAAQPQDREVRGGVVRMAC